MMKRISDLWCRTMHDAAMWPVHGRYECRTCGRTYQVAWEQTEERTAHEGIGKLELIGASK